MLGAPYEEKGFELGGLDLNGDSYITSEQMVTHLALALEDEIPFEEDLSGDTPQARLLSWQRHYYWDEGQTDALPLGEIAAQELLHHTETAVFSEDQIQDVFSDKVTDDILGSDGG